MAGATTREFDVADHLSGPEEIAAYLDAVLEDGDDKLLLVALRHVVKSRGFAKVAQGAGVRRETLYQSFSEDGNLRLSTLEKFYQKIYCQKYFCHLPWRYLKSP